MDILDLIKQNSFKLGERNSNKLKNIRVIENLNTKAPEELISSKSLLLSKTFLIFFILIIFFYIFKIYKLQIIDYEKFNQLSQRNYIRSEIILANRGLIFDRNGNILVKNVPRYILNQNISKCVVNKNRDFSLCEKHLDILQKYVQFDLIAVKDSYKKNEIITIKRDLTKDEAILIGSIKNVESLEVSILPQREYTNELTMSHLLGYVSQSDTKIGEYEGKMGVEKYYEDFLSGISGSNLYKSDSLNTKLDNYQQISPIAGKDIKLSINEGMQNYAFELLSSKVSSMPSAVGGVVIAQDPRNGDILTLVNFPTFNLNKISKGLSEKEYQDLIKNNSYPFLNRAVSGVYPPGSVFKIVTASGILEDGIAKPEDTIYDEGFIKIGESTYGNWKRDGHGVVDYAKSMKVSNDTYYYIFSGGYKTSKGLGISGIYNWSKKYKLGEPQGIDLPGESSGFIPDGKYKTWYLGDTFISAIGQGDVLATPIQMSTLMSYFANNQKAYVPRVVLEADNLLKKERVLYENLLSSKNFEIIRDSLRQVNNFGGTAHPFHNFKTTYGFDSAGKTGTSEYFDSRYQKVLTHAWYSGFAPYEKPEIVVTVFIESGGGGSDDAAPLARKLIDFYFKNKK